MPRSREDRVRKVSGCSRSATGDTFPGPSPQGESEMRNLWDPCEMPEVEKALGAEHGVCISEPAVLTDVNKGRLIREQRYRQECSTQASAARQIQGSNCSLTTQVETFTLTLLPSGEKKKKKKKYRNKAN